MTDDLDILLVEDEDPMRHFLRLVLAAQRYRLIEATTGAEGLRLAAIHNPGVVLLDLGLPDIDGIEVTRRLRVSTLAPIIILSARGQERDKVQALDAGADDYLTKPFGLQELLARLRVAQRHAQRARQAPIETAIAVGPLRIDLGNHRVSVEEREVRLTPTEYKLLLAVARNAGRVLTHQQLLKMVGGDAGYMHCLHVYMSHLRSKLEADPVRPRLLITEPGVGYRLDAE